LSRLRNETDWHLRGSAIVFAPHQDDETLGCGGTIILKRKAGLPVTIVFMTDGSTSHASFMRGDELRQVRNEEALQAARQLGVDAAEVRFLDFPDSKLVSCHEIAVTQVLDVLHRQRPDDVFIPYGADGTPDHEATYRIVVEAVQKSGLALRVCEYPIWIWNQWPWVSVPVHANRESLRTLWRVIQSGFGALLFRKLRSGVFVGDVLHTKRQALEQHRSQMTALMDGVGWPTLASVSGGEFLNCFFQPFELFHCWNSNPTASEEMS